MICNAAFTLDAFSMPQAHRCALSFQIFYSASFCCLNLSCLLHLPASIHSSLSRPTSLKQYPSLLLLAFASIYFFGPCQRVCIAGIRNSGRFSEGRCVCRSVGGRVRVLCDAWLMSLTSSSQASFHTHTHAHTLSQK